MKNILAVLAATVLFLSCEKANNDLFCWTCVAEVYDTQPSGTVYTYRDSTVYCDQSEKEIKILENRYKERELGHLKYSDLKCHKQD